MAEGMNKVFLLGNLGADPELKMLNGGQAVLNLRVATAESYKDQSGEWKERTEWHTVQVWGKRGESLAKILFKGSRVCVEGKLQTRASEKNGEKRYFTSVNATSVYLCDARRGGGDQEEMPSGGGGTRRQSAPKQQHAPTAYDGFDDMGGDNDIPF